jgi:hypothetical protein
MPTVHNVKKTAGVAGQVQYTAVLSYPEEDGYSTVSFVGSCYGEPGPVLMITEATAAEGGVFVTEPGRFGSKFGPEWVRRFFGGGE